MSQMTRSDNADDLVTSVRHLVSNEATGISRKMPSLDRLVLTPALRVGDVDDVPDTTAQDQTTPANQPDEPERLDLAPVKAHVDADAPTQPVSDDPVLTETATDADLTDLTALDGVAITDVAAQDPVTDQPEPDLETQVVTDVVMKAIGGQIDDTALRDAVRRVLREELSGEMGERITRNVRKLVRREINRVLASRELD